MLVYFAHPIDQSNGHNGATNVTDLLRQLDIPCYLPGSAFGLTAKGLPSAMDQIDLVNNSALEHCTALLAWLPPGVPTLGVPSEIECALHRGMPTVILTKDGLSGRSVQMANWRRRGAEVIEFDHHQKLLWEAMPDAFIEMLTSYPDPTEVASRAFEESCAAANRTPLLLPEASFTFQSGFKSEPDLKYALAGGARPLTRGHSDDAGLDLAILNDEQLKPGEYRLLSTGVRMAVPRGYWGLIAGRSSTWATHRCDVRSAVIDAGYRGELMIGLENRSGGYITFSAGTRLAQYIILPAFLGHAVETAELPDSARGENGYGSTGA
jgi:dUTP pyrophosphatase